MSSVHSILEVLRVANDALLDQYKQHARDVSLLQDTMINDVLPGVLDDVRAKGGYEEEEVSRIEAEALDWLEDSGTLLPILVQSHKLNSLVLSGSMFRALKVSSVVVHGVRTRHLTCYLEAQVHKELCDAGSSGHPDLAHKDLALSASRSRALNSPSCAALPCFGPIRSTHSARQGYIPQQLELVPP
jgi:hypothetical protein